MQHRLDLEDINNLENILADLILRRPFPYLGRRIEFSIFPLSGVVLLLYFYCFSFVSLLLPSLHLSFGLQLFPCPPTSIFHELIDVSSSVFLSTWPNHLSIASLIVSLIFATSVSVSVSVLANNALPAHHTCLCSCLVISDLLNPLYSYHPSQHSHLCSF